MTKNTSHKSNTQYNGLSYKDFVKAAAFAGVIAAPVLLATVFAQPDKNHIRNHAGEIWSKNQTNPIAPAIIQLTRQ